MNNIENIDRIEALMARAVDEHLSQEEQEELNQALFASEELRNMEAELALIKDMASRETPPCPTGIFHRIQEQVDETYARKTGGFLSLFRRYQPALALVAALLVAAVYFVVRQPVESVDPSMEKLQLNIRMAQQQYHEAIAQMEQAAIAHMETMPSDLAIAYAHNLHKLNNAITQCEQLLDKHAGDPLIYRELSRAYAAKADLLDSILNT